MKIVETSVKRYPATQIMAMVLFFACGKYRKKLNFYRLIINTYGYYLVSKG